MAQKNTVFGEVSVRPGESLGKVGAGTETVENVMAMADAIWGRVRQSGIGKTDTKACEKLARELQAKYHDFVTTFPIVFRWMVHTREYEREVFRKFIKSHTKAMYKTQDEFLEVQAQYLMMLYRKRNPRAGAAQMKRRREIITKSLKDDNKQFQEAVKESESVIKQIDEVNLERRRAAIAAWAKARGGR